MSCDCCDGPVKWDDDDDCEICDNCLERMNAEVHRYEPTDDPQPRELLPDPESTAIEHARRNPANVARLYHGFAGLVEHARNTPREGVLTEIDVLGALDVILRAYVEEMVLARAPLSPTAAIVNRTAIIHMLHKLIDDVLGIDLPQPVVN